MPFEKIQSEKLAHSVVKQIELLILRGILRPGERLPSERDLAERMGVSDGANGTIIWLGDEWFSVVGIMETLDLSPDLDRSALVSYRAAETYLEHDPTAAEAFAQAERIEATVVLKPPSKMINTSARVPTMKLTR